MTGTAAIGFAPTPDFIPEDGIDPRVELSLANPLRLDLTQQRTRDRQSVLLRSVGGNRVHED